MTKAADLKAQAMAARTRRLAAEREESELREAAKKAEREEAQEAQRREAEEHYNRMLTEIGEPLAGLNAAQHGAVYAMAWEHGHSYGFSEVESYYGDFAELARKILDAK